jgi:hypothetical protein
MKLIFRLFIVIVLLGGIALLAQGGIARAGGAAQVASQSGTASLTGMVWDDKDQDGLQEIGERGIQNVSVELYDNSRVLVTMALTDQAGQYRFDKLTPGNYYVHVTAPTGYAISLKDQGNNEATDSDADLATGETVPVMLLAGENSQKWDAGLYASAAVLSLHDPGTVRPPSRIVILCRNGVKSVGGVSTLEVTNLKPGYCLVAVSGSHIVSIGRIPDGSGTILAPITYLSIFYRSRLVYGLPEKDGNSRICYAAPPGKTVQIHFLNFYSARFGRRIPKPTWEPLPTTVEDGMACAPAQFTGAYALIGK